MDGEGTIAVKTFNRSKITLEKEIGSGSFGKVYKASIKDFKVQVAVKVFFQDFFGVLPNVDSKMRDTAYEELTKVAVLDHQNVVRLLGMVEDDIPWLVFEYMKDGNLLEFVMRKREIKEKTLLRFCRDICNGMAFLHRNNFLHKDLAARNILLEGKTAKIADMGLCSFLTEEHDGSYALGGKLFPYRHAASECIVECIFTYESDVWSFGVLIWEVFTGGLVPYGDENKQPEVRRFIADGMNPSSFQEPICSDEVRSIMNSIFQYRREDRPTFVDLHSYFDGLLRGQGVRIPRPRRDASPYRTVAHPHQRVNELHSSSERMSFSPKSSNQNLLGTEILNSSFISSSNPDIHGTMSKQPSNRSRAQVIRKQEQPGSNNLLGLSPPTSFYGDRRYSETPNTENLRNDFLTVGSQRDKSPRRTSSFSNISRPENYQNSGHIDKNLLKDFVPNRFGGSNKNLY